MSQRTVNPKNNMKSETIAAIILVIIVVAIGLSYDNDSIKEPSGASTWSTGGHGYDH